MVSFQELYEAYLSCRKNKRNSISALKFELDLISNLWKLYYEINSKVYIPKRYISFLAHSPKTREVFASDFSDRIVHHLLVNDLEPLFEPKFIFDSYSCRKEKGIHLAIQRTQKFSRKEQNKFYMQLDIKNFFLSIDKNILFDLIEIRLNEISSKDPSFAKIERVKYLSHKVIFDDPTTKYIFKGKKAEYKHLPKHKSLLFTPKNRGLPIGNLTSQFFANFYMNPFDNYVKRVLKGDYIRYVDDFIIFGKNKEELIEKKAKMELFLAEKLNLSIKDNTRILPVDSGIDFLGYITRPKYILVRKRVVNNFKYKLAKFRISKKNQASLILLKQQFASYMGHFQHANSYNLISKYSKILDFEMGSNK